MKVTGVGRALQLQSCLFLWSAVTFGGKLVVLSAPSAAILGTTWITFQWVLEKSSVSFSRVMWESFDGLVALQWSDLITSLWKMVLLACELFSFILWHIPFDRRDNTTWKESLISVSWGLFFFYIYPEVQVSNCFVVSAKLNYNLRSCKQMGRRALQDKITNACWLIGSLDLNRPRYLPQSYWQKIISQKSVSALSGREEWPTGSGRKTWGKSFCIIKVPLKIQWFTGAAWCPESPHWVA